MIVFDLRCADSCDVFEAWFQSSADFEEQSKRGLVQCPACQSTRIAKAPMAPRLPAKSEDSPLARLAAAQAKALVEDGVPVAPLPLPVTPPSQVN
jgi:hypothetical protein